MLEAFVWHIPIRHTPDISTLYSLISYARLPPFCTAGRPSCEIPPDSNTVYQTHSFWLAPRLPPLSCHPQATNQLYLPDHQSLHSNFSSREYSLSLILCPAMQCPRSCLRNHAVGGNLISDSWAPRFFLVPNCQRTLSAWRLVSEIRFCLHPRQEFCRFHQPLTEKFRFEKLYF